MASLAFRFGVTTIKIFVFEGLNFVFKNTLSLTQSNTEGCRPMLVKLCMINSNNHMENKT